MSEDWFWAGIIVAVPFAIFGLIEIALVLRRRRQKAIARRSKEAPTPRPNRAMGRVE